MGNGRAYGMVSRGPNPRGKCPACGKRGLGNVQAETWRAHPIRECRYCGHGAPVKGYES